jgi:rhodanese-related sulfurtransferase
MTPDALERLMQSAVPHAVLDLRERGAYERDHVFRSTSLPRRLLEFRLPGLVPALATPIVLCDEDGALAGLAKPTVAAMGYTDVRILGGGLKGWRDSGRATVQGVNVPSKVFGERVLHDLKTPEISPSELRERIDRGDDLVIVDSRTPEEYARGCVPGAWSVPGAELVLRIGDLVERPETAIVVHCGGRTRSYVGAESLRRMQLPNPVVALRNGTMGWELAGFALERGATRWAPPVSPTSRAAAALVARRVAGEEHVAFLSADDVARLWERRREEHVALMDVRTADEYAAGHVPGAVWAPGGQVVQAVDDYLAVWSGRVVLVCDGLVRSVMTAAWLGKMGLPGVAVLLGGVPAWTAAGHPVEAGAAIADPWGWEAAQATVEAAAPGSLAGALVLDVGGSDAYARGHVPGAVWVCRSRLEAGVAVIAPDRARSLVTTCSDGRHSTLAASTLRGLGYRDVRVLDGGTDAWRRAGLPLETGPTRLADEPDDVVPKPYDRGRGAMEAYLRWEECLDDRGRSPHALL